MGADLKYNTDKLNDFSDKMVQLHSDLLSTKNKLINSLETLQQDWNTETGRRFFSENTFEWQEKVDKYLLLIDTLKCMINQSITEYNDVSDNVKNIKLE